MKYNFTVDLHIRGVRGRLKLIIHSHIGTVGILPIMSKFYSHWDPDWVCPMCNVTIHGRKSSCVKCKTPKVKEGDWFCQCRTFNFRDKTACMKCQLPKPACCECANPVFKRITSGNIFIKEGGCTFCFLLRPTPEQAVELERLRQLKPQVEEVIPEQTGESERLKPQVKDVVPNQKPFESKKRSQVQVLEDRIAQLEQEAIGSEKRFSELEARLARLESQ